MNERTTEQAVRNEALKEAAELCIAWGNARKDKYGGNALRNCAAAIRALIEPLSVTDSVRPKLTERPIERCPQCGYGQIEQNALLTQAADSVAVQEPEGWKAFIESCAEREGQMVNGNDLSRAAHKLLAASPTLDNEAK